MSHENFKEKSRISGYLLVNGREFYFLKEDYTHCGGSKTSNNQKTYSGFSFKK